MEINYLAVGVAAISSFFIGGLWYSPLLFQKQWMKENGFSEEDLKSGNMLVIFLTSLLCSLIISINLAAFLGPDASISWGAGAGALAGFGWVAMGYAVTYSFERKSIRLWLINAGYHVLSFTLMGTILTAW